MVQNKENELDIYIGKYPRVLEDIFEIGLLIVSECYNKINFGLEFHSTFLINFVDIAFL